MTLNTILFSLKQNLRCSLSSPFVQEDLPAHDGFVLSVNIAAERNVPDDEHKAGEGGRIVNVFGCIGTSAGVCCCKARAITVTIQAWLWLGYAQAHAETPVVDGVVVAFSQNHLWSLGVCGKDLYVQAAVTGLHHIFWRAEGRESPRRNLRSTVRGLFQMRKNFGSRISGNYYLLAHCEIYEFDLSLGSGDNIVWFQVPVYTMCDC